MKAYVAVSVVGALYAVRKGRKARFAGVRLPGTPLGHALTIGSPLSAPPGMLIALLLAQRLRRLDVVSALSVTFLVGVVAEADNAAALRHASDDPLATACVVLEVVLPVAMFVAARRSIARLPERYVSTRR